MLLFGSIMVLAYTKQDRPSPTRGIGMILLNHDFTTVPMFDDINKHFFIQ